MKNKDFADYLSIYFNNYLILERNVSSNTIRSYKYAFKSLVNFLVDEKKIDLKNIKFNIITKDVIREYLIYLEEKENCSINTRNQRLAAIKSFFSFLKAEDPSLLVITQNILSIKKKKYTNQNFEYLTKNEITSFLNSIDTSSNKGIRDLVLITLLYDTAIRSEELVSLKVKDVVLDDINPKITVVGKGNKTRTIPIMNKTKILLLKYIKHFNIDSTSYLFSGNKTNKASTKMIYHIIKKYTAISGINKTLSPHSFRHSRAIHLVESGINIIYVRDLLGHSSITTTENYLKISVETKRKAINQVYTIKNNSKIPKWNSDEELLTKLLEI